MTRCVLVLTEQRVVALHEANGVRPYPGVLLQSPGEKIFLFLFLTRFLHSLSLSRTCLMSWHLFFQFLYQPLHTHTNPLYHFLSMPAHTLSCLSISSSSSVLSAGIHNAPEGTEEHHHPLLSQNIFYHSTSYSLR